MTVAAAQHVVAAVIPCYNPDITSLGRLAARLVAAHVRVVLVNDGGPNFAIDDCDTIVMPDNQGIGSAQNAGIAAAREAGANIVLFFDQDSAIDERFIDSLLRDLKPAQAMVCAARAVDDQTGHDLPVIRLDGQGSRHVVTIDGDGAPLVADIVISSGMAITMLALDKVGPMDASLFIDQVDTEWCLRAKAARVPLMIVPDAVMHHRIGRNVRRRLGQNIVIHSPERSYFQIRNPLLLLRRAYVPKRYAVHEAATTFISRMLLITLVPDPTRYIRFITRGVLDGILGRSGPCPIR